MDYGYSYGGSFGGISSGLYGSSFGSQFSAYPQFSYTPTSYNYQPAAASYPTFGSYYPSFTGQFGNFGSSFGAPTATATANQNFGARTGFDAFAAAPALTGPSAKVVLAGDGRVRADKREEAVAAVRQMSSEARKEPGCIKFEWSQSIEDQNLLIIYECWSSEDDLQRHLDSDSVKTFKQSVQELFAVDPAVQKTSIGSWEDI